MKKITRKSFLYCMAVAASTPLLSACGGGNGSAADSGNETQNIKFEMFSYGETPDQEMVMQRLNELSKEKINVTCDIEFFNMANYEEQIGLKMAGQEEMDLIMILGTTGEMVSQGQLMPADELFDQYGQGIKDTCGDLLYYCTVDGQNYGAPFYANMTYYTTLICRKDICDECGIDPNSLMTIEGISAAYAIVQEKHPEMVLLAPDGANLLGGYYDFDSSLCWHVDNMSGCIGIVMNDSTEIVDIFESDVYASELAIMRDWYQKGYIMRDSATTSEVGSLSYREGNLFSYICGQSCFLDGPVPQVHAGLTAITYPTYAIPLSKPVISSSDMLAVGISSNSKHPEAAMKWLNLLYTDPDMVSTLYYGVEGHHWQMRDDGLAEYCDGIEPGNTGWDTAFCWSTGNSGESVVFAANSTDPEANIKQCDANKEGTLSVAFGFYFDTSAVSTQYASVQNVIAKYTFALESGSVDPTEQLPLFIAELKAAGIDDIIAEKQRQFDKFLAEKKQ